MRSSHHRSFSSKFVNRRPLIPKIDIPKKQEAILVTRNSGGIGDLLMLTPIFRQLKKENPSIPLILCTTENYMRGSLFDIMKYNPHVDKVIKVDELSNYDVKKIYNFNTGQEIGQEIGPHPTKNRIDIFAEISGITLDDKKTVYTISPAEKEWARNWIIKNIASKRRRLIGIHVASTATRRTWPSEKQWLLAFKLVGKYPDVTVLFFNEGTPPEMDAYPNIIQIGSMPIRWIAALMNECELLICPDSGLLHIAGALNKKIVGIFGPQPPKSRLLYYENSVGVSINYPCSANCFYDRCFSEFRCTTEIPVEMVMEKAEELLHGKVERGNLELKKSKETLVIRMGGIGDIILLSNALRAYKMDHPYEELVFATKPANLDVLKDAPFLKNIIPIPESYKTIYSKVFDLRNKFECPAVGGSLDTQVYQTENRTVTIEKLLGVTTEEKKYYVNVNQEAVNSIKERIKYDSKINKKFKWLGIQLTCTSNTRTIPPEYILDISKQFQTVKGLKIVVFGQKEFWHGRKIGTEAFNRIRGKNIINLMDKTDTAEMIALISVMDYIVAPDSSAVHIAGALNKPCLALFGNMDPYLRVYFYPSVKALYPKNELSCIPCWDFSNPCIHHFHLPTPSQPIGGECLRKLTPKRIFDAASEWFRFNISIKKEKIKKCMYDGLKE